MCEELLFDPFEFIFWLNIVTKEEFDILMKRAIERAPLARLVTTDEVANLTAFLCDDGSSGMTGQTIYVDGGCHAVA